MIKTFRALLADGGQDQIRLQTIKGKVGYRVLKLQAISESPGTVPAECILKLYKSKQTTVDALIDFSDSDLLGCAFWTKDAAIVNPVGQQIVFDNEIVNQDIYVTQEDTSSAGTAACNYYLELEVVPLDDAGAEYTTLKDMRST